MSFAPLICFFTASLVCLDAAAVTSRDVQADDAEVVVTADAKQMMRNVNHPAANHAHAHHHHHSGHKAHHGHHSKHVGTTQKAGDDVKAKSATTVTISLFYESKCPDCVLFVNQTLEPLWRNQDLRKHLKITMNPYGNAMSIPLANVSEGYKFWHPKSTGKDWQYVHICQHGPDECKGNLIQACAINMVEQSKYMELIFCMASVPDWGIEKSSYDCMKKANIDHTAIKKCVDSPQGNALFADLGKQTQAVPGRLGTPWVMIDGANLQNTTDLMRTVCDHVEDGPSSCSPFKNAPAPPKQKRKEAGADDDGFEVLPAFKKSLAVLPPKNI